MGSLSFGRRFRTDRCAGEWDERHSRAYHRAISAGYRGQAERVRLRAPDAADILDAGTGSGLMLAALAQVYPEARLIGLDAAPAQLEIAAEQLAEEVAEGRVRLVEGSVFRMPLPDASFDVVTASELIHCLADPTTFFAEALRVLRPGGMLVVFDWRRDCGLFFYAAAKFTSALMRLVRAPLTGMGPVLDACWTQPEVEGFLEVAGWPRADVRAARDALGVVAVKPAAATEAPAERLPDAAGNLR